MMKHILIVDDEQRMRELLTLYLTPIGYQCTAVSSGQDAINAIQTEDFDLILLDVMMPVMDGWETCKSIRKISEIPIIMLTARSTQTDIVKGFHTGADDYIVKPFNAPELIARIQAILRRVSASTTATIQLDGLFWNPDAYTVHFHNKPIKLTPKEFGILGLFLQYPNYVFQREDLLVGIWGNETDTEGRTIDSHIRNIRDKLKAAHFPIDEVLLTVWGVGYKWRKH